MFAALGTLLMLIFLQVVLGFDNLLYISLESKRVEAAQQQRVRKIGVIIAIVLRIVLLFVIFFAIQALEGALFEIDLGLIEAKVGCFVEDSRHHLTLLPNVKAEACTGEGQVVTWLVCVSVISIVTAAFAKSAPESTKSPPPKVGDTFDIAGVL